MKETEPQGSVRDKVVHLIRGVEAERTTAGLEDLFVRLAYRAYPGMIPPEYVLHAAQVDTVTAAILSDADDMEKEWGKLYSWSHDIGRAVDYGPTHTRAGARILREYGYRSSLVTYTLAHHRWGLGVPILGPDEYPRAVDLALSNGNVDRMMEEIIAKRGLAAVATLLADNSKRPAAPGSFESEIAPYTLDQAETLIELQIIRGRYTGGSREHAMDQLGARFLAAMIPHLEQRLGITYAPDGSGNDVISKAQSRWPEVKESLLAKWKRIYRETPASGRSISMTL